MCFGGGRWRQKRERNAHANPLPFPNLHTQAAASLRLIGDAGESEEYVLGEFFGVWGGECVLITPHHALTPFPHLPFTLPLPKQAMTKTSLALNAAPSSATPCPCAAP